MTQKRLRGQEEDSQRVHDHWANEKDSWEEERRKYERKVHVAESRLKVVLNEVAAYESAHANGLPNGAHESEAEEPPRENDAASVRTMSMTNSVRFSMMNGSGLHGKVNGHSLADELNLDGDEDWQTDADGRDSIMYNHVRTMSKESVMSKLHMRNQSMESLKRPGSVARGKLFVNQSVLETLEDGIREEEVVAPAAKPDYKDTGIQYSPPPSPKLQPSKPSTPEPPLRAAEVDSPSRGSPRGEWEVEANQRRKRVHISRPLSIEPPKIVQQMVSAGSQTVEEPLSPPKTPPKSPARPATPPMPAPIPEIKLPAMVSSATQTNLPSPPDFTAMPPPKWVISCMSILIWPAAPVIRTARPSRVIAISVSATTRSPSQLLASPPNKISKLFLLVGEIIEAPGKSQWANKSFHSNRAYRIKEVARPR